MYIMDDVLDLMDSLGEALEKGKRGAKRVLRGEGGFGTLVTVLVILALGAIIITPLLVFVVTGQRAGRTHNEVTDRLYAADTGIQDGMWRVLNDDLPSWMLGTWGSDTYSQSHTYTLPDPVNGCDVTVKLRGVWLLEGLETPKPEQAMMPHAKFVTVGAVTGFGQYKVVIMDKGITGNYKINRIGVWIPAGYTYTPGSSNLENLATTHPAYIVPTVSEFKNGHTVIWDYAAEGRLVNYTDLPAETETRRVVTFNYTPGGPMANAFAWCRTNRNDIYLSWSGDIKQFHLEATATDSETGRSTTVIAANMKNEGMVSGMAINGDYAATGNALVRDNDGDLYRFKERLYEKTPGTISGIPDSGTARRIMLYWTGWKDFPLNAWYEEKVDVGAWTYTNRSLLHNLVANYKVNRVSLTVKIDSGPYAGEYLISGALPADTWQVIPATKADDTVLPYRPWLQPNGWFYSCQADVTDLVKDTLRDTYGVDLSTFNGEATYVVGHADDTVSLVSEAVLQGVWGSSANDIYVVGDSGTIAHYDGISWKTVATGATTRSLKGVWGSSGGDVWAVGDVRSVGGNSYNTVVYSSDNGATWQDLGVTWPSAYSCHSSQHLKAVWGSSSTDVWAVGDSYKPSATTYFTILNIRDNGTSVVRTTTVPGVTTGQTLYAIWGVPSEHVYAVGANGTILHYSYDLDAWSAMTSGTTAQLNGVWGIDRENIWAVGNGGAILYYNGTSWSSPSWTRPSGWGWDYTNVTLYGVWGTGGTPGTDGHRVYAVGYNNSTRRGVVWYNEGGSQWYNDPCGATRQLYDAWGSAQDNIYAVGVATTTAGTLIHYDGVDHNGDGYLWDPVVGGTNMYSWNAANRSLEKVVASTDYALGDPGTSFGDATHPNYQLGHAAWSILVIYTSPETKGHQLYIYDTLEASGRKNTKELKIEGFLAPASVLTDDHAARITCFVGEGDERIWADGRWQLDGDNIYLNGYRLNNRANGTALAANDVWNARSSEMDADGIDIDTFYISGSGGIIQPGDSEAIVKFETKEDVWNMVYMILSLRSDLSGTGLLTYIVK